MHTWDKVSEHKILLEFSQKYISHWDSIPDIPDSVGGLSGPFPHLAVTFKIHGHPSGVGKCTFPLQLSTSNRSLLQLVT